MNKKDVEAVIATNRFGMGARPNEINEAKHDPRAWLIDSLAPIIPPKNAPTAIEMIRLLAKYKIEKKSIKMMLKEKSVPTLETSKSDKKLKSKISPNEIFNSNSGLILQNSITANDSINWRLLDFFSNHFSVSANNPGMRFLAPTLDWDAIAPNLMGQFSTMLIAVASHPSMLLYLNNERSIGPNSSQGKKNKKRGLNENLAREILELHTLGVNGGYTQAEVIELAKALTGWSIAKSSKKKEYEADNAFIYRELTHEPGSRHMLGKNYTSNIKPAEQGKQILNDLARHPSTAEHLCFKMARHFISDNPSKKLVKAMKETWLTTDGNLKSVVTTMIKSNYSWSDHKQKYKTPREFIISAYRAMSIDKVPSNQLISSLRHLAQTPYQAGSPAGYGDERVNWDGANALYAQIEWAAKLARQQRQHPITTITNTALKDQLNDQTKLIVNRAESQEQAISLFLMSPDFMFR